MNEYIYNGEYDYMDVEDFIVLFDYNDYAEYDMENDFEELGLLPYVDSSDWRYNRIVNMPVSENVMTIVCHGNAYEIGINYYHPGETTPYMQREISLDVLVADLEEDPEWMKHRYPIALIACYGGSEDDGIAQQIATRLKVPVTACIMAVRIAEDGTYYASEEKIIDNDHPDLAPEVQYDRWRIFYPK